MNRNGQFNADELSNADKFHIKFQNTQMAIISFYEVDFSFDLSYLQKALSDSQFILKQIVHRHLTDKSLSRIDEVFEFFNNPQFLECIFKPNSVHREIMGKIVADLNKSLENEET